MGGLVTLAVGALRFHGTDDLLGEASRELCSPCERTVRLWKWGGIVRLAFGAGGCDLKI